MTIPTRLLATLSALLWAQSLVAAPAFAQVRLPDSVPSRADTGPTNAVAATDVDAVRRRFATLDDLLQRGLISEAEWKAHRTRIIDEAVRAVAATPPTEPVPKPPTIAPSAYGFRQGDRLRYVDRDGLSNVATGNATFAIDRIDPQKTSLNGGSIVIRRDGTPETGQYANAYIYQYINEERSVKARFRVEGYNDIVSVDLTPNGAGTMDISGVKLQVRKFLISGRAAQETPMGQQNHRPQSYKGAEISGELIIDDPTGMTISIRARSQNLDYNFTRELTAITR